MPAWHQSLIPLRTHCARSTISMLLKSPSSRHSYRLSPVLDDGRPDAVLKTNFTRVLKKGHTNSSPATLTDAPTRVHSRVAGNWSATSNRSITKEPDRSCVARKDASKTNCHGPSLDPTSLQLTSKPSILGIQYSQHAQSQIAILDTAHWRPWAYTSNARTRIGQQVAQF
jgi:hypothetical protein